MLLDTPACDFGWKGVDFTLKDAHGQPHVMRDYSGDGGLLIAFMCNHCPYVKAIAKRFGDTMRDLQKKGVNALAIMSNDYTNHPEDHPKRMIAFAKANGWDFPYLIDRNQNIARNYGAVCTPDFFGFNATGALQYRGRFDDAIMGDATHAKRELYDAMIQIAQTGQGPREQMPGVGCSIKWIDESKLD